MAHVLRCFLQVCHQGRLIHRCAATCLCSPARFDKNPLQSPIGAKYVGRRGAPEHLWLEKFKAEIQSGEKQFVLSERWIEDLENKFKAESNGNLVNFDLVLMATLKVARQPKMAILLMQYIRKRRKPNILVIIEYMLCCHVEHPKLILEEYKTLKQSLDLATVSINTLCSLAKVAARTSLWRDAYEILELLQKEVELGESREVLEHAVASVLCSGIVTSNYELLLEMAYKHPRWYNRSLRKGMITPTLFEAWKKGDMHLDLIFEMLHDMGQFLNLRDGQALEIQEYCKKNLADKVVCELTEVDEKSGVCQQCSEQLSSSNLTKSEFKLLQQAMIEKLVYGENIYQSTTPEAIGNFLNFLKDARYDVVFDGPNVYYDRDIEFWNVMPELLKDIRKFLRKKSVKALIIADTVRFKAFYKVPPGLESAVDVYQVDFRLSSDDIFMLVAAFKSGPNTYIVTNDNLRNHKIRLGDPCDKLFSVWQKRFQIMHDYDVLEFPAGYDSRTHVTDKGWHVPYELDEKTFKKNQAYFKDTKKFMCVQKLRPFSSGQLRAYREMKSKFEEMYKKPIDESLI